MEEVSEHWGFRLVAMDGSGGEVELLDIPPDTGARSLETHGICKSLVILAQAESDRQEYGEVIDKVEDLSIYSARWMHALYLSK